jgi:hypothetical protein
LNDEESYNLSLDQSKIRMIYDHYRGLLTHHSVTTPGVSLDIGQDKGSVFEVKGKTPCLNLLPFLQVSKVVVEKFMGNADTIIPGSRALGDIMGKGLPTSEQISLGPESAFRRIDASSTPASGWGGFWPGPKPSGAMRNRLSALSTTLVMRASPHQAI